MVLIHRALHLGRMLFHYALRSDDSKSSNIIFRYNYVKSDAICHMPVLFNSHSNGFYTIIFGRAKLRTAVRARNTQCFQVKVHGSRANRVCVRPVQPHRSPTVFQQLRRCVQSTIIGAAGKRPRSSAGHRASYIVWPSTQKVSPN